MATRPARRSQTASRGSSRPALRVVRGRARKWSPVPVVVCVVLTVFGVTALEAWMSQDGLRTAVVERQVTAETERLELLRARVAQLETPGRIADEADKAGLVADPSPGYLKVPLDPPDAGPQPDAGLQNGSAQDPTPGSLDAFENLTPTP